MAQTKLKGLQVLQQALTTTTKLNFKSSLKFQSIDMFYSPRSLMTIATSGYDDQLWR